MDPVLEFSQAFNAFCATGEGGGVDPTCSPGEGGGGGTDKGGGQAPKRERINYKGDRVTIEHTGPGQSKIVEGPTHLVGKALKLKAKPAAPAPTPAAKEPTPAAPPPAEKAAERPEAPARTASAPSFKTPEEAEDHFSSTYRTNLSRGRMSDAEYVKTAAALATEHDRLSSEFQLVQKTLGQRTSRGQTLKLGEDFSAETGSARGASSSYKFGEGVRLGNVPLGEHRAPAIGQHAVDGGTDLRTQFRHEFAHEMFNSGLSRAKQSDWVKVAKPFLGTATVSRYGGTNESELFSESFAAYSSPRYVRGSLPAKIEGWLDKNVRGRTTDNEWTPFSAEATWNAFCPTGEGGGIDPSCSPGGGGRGPGNPAETARAAKEERLKERVKREVSQAASEVKFSDEPKREDRGRVEITDHAAIESRMTREERQQYNRYMNDRREAWVERELDDMDRPSVAERDVLQAADIDLSEASRFASVIAERTETAEDEEELVSIVREWEQSVGDPDLSDFERLRNEIVRHTLPPREDGTEIDSGPLEEGLDQIIDDLQQRYESAEQELQQETAREMEEDLDSQYEDSDEYVDDAREYLETFYRENRERYAPQGDDASEKVWRPRVPGNGASMEFSTSSGGRYSIDVYTGSGPGGIQVDEVQFSDEDGQFSVTGAGGAHEVFSNVVAGVAAYAMEKEPPAMKFSAYGESRQRLYDKLVKTVSHALPGYSAVKLDAGSGPHSTRYYLVAKREHMEGLKDWLKTQKGVEPQVLVNRLDLSAGDLDLWSLDAVLGGWVPFSAEAAHDAAKWVPFAEAF